LAGWIDADGPFKNFTRTGSQDNGLAAGDALNLGLGDFQDARESRLEKTVSAWIFCKVPSIREPSLRVRVAPGA
jgi:hypothetical protein